MKFNLPMPFILAGPAPLLLLFFTRRRKPVILASAVIILLVTASIYSFSSLNTVDESDLHFYNDRGITEMKGMVSEEPDVRDKNTRLLLSVKEIRIEDGRREVDGEALVFVSRYPEYHYGDVLKVTGIPATPQQFDDFDYSGYLEHQGIYTVVFYPSVELLDTEKGFAPLAWIYSLRTGLAENIAETLPEPQASLAQGIILGMRGNIPEELRENFAASGAAHLLAISGLHLGIMAGVLLAIGIMLFGKRHYLYVWLAIGAIWFYVVITGVHLPVVRGAIMATLFLLAEFLGRQRSAIVALTLAAAVMVGVSPYILGDASFQLSFLAMAGLVFIFPVLRNAGRNETRRVFGEDSRALPAVNAITDAVSATLGALLAVWPVVAHYFGIVSLAAPFTTLLALPALPMIIVLGGLTGILGFASAVVAQGFGWLVWLFLSYMLMVVNGLATPAISAIEIGPVSPVFLGIYYALLTLVIWIHRNRNRLFKRIRESAEQPIAHVPFRLPRTAKWVVIPLIAAAVLTVYTAATMPDDKLHVSFLDVGEGDAILIRKGNRQVLVDGGPSPQAIRLELGKQMPYWDRTIELLVLTHPHSDHMTGLVEVIRCYRVTGIMEPDCDYDSPLYREWQRLIDEKRIAVTTARAGLIIDMGDGIIIEVLNPTARNEGETLDIDNNSAVLRLTTDDISFLLTGDIMREAEWEIIRRGYAPNSTVLKAAHHGSDTSTTAEFLVAVDPHVAVISCGRDNKHGHPNEDVLSRLEREVGAGNIYRSDVHGTVEFITDGERLWVETER